MQIEFISCAARAPTEKWHFAHALRQDYARIDTNYLRFLVINNGEVEKKRDCTYAGGPVQKRKFCGGNIYLAYTKSMLNLH